MVFTEEIKSKNQNAVAELYNRYGKKLYGYGISKWNLSEDDSWDMVYKTLFRVIEVIDRYTFETEQKFAGFIFKTFINYLRNHYRDNKGKHLETSELNESFTGAVSEKNETEEDKESSKPMKCLQKILQTFEDWQRVVLLMRAQDYAYEEIANYVNKPAEQLKVYYMRLKKIVTEKVNECVNGESIVIN